MLSIIKGVAGDDGQGIFTDGTVMYSAALWV